MGLIARLINRRFVIYFFMFSSIVEALFLTAGLWCQHSILLSQLSCTVLSLHYHPSFKHSSIASVTWVLSITSLHAQPNCFVENLVCSIQTLGSFMDKLYIGSEQYA